MTRARWILSALLLAAPGLGCAQALDEAAVRKMLSEVDRAVAARNPDAVAHHISDSATLTVDVTVNGQAQRISMRKPEYVNAMRETWSAVDRYDYRRSDVRISIAGGRATVTSIVTESVTMQGRTLNTTTSDTSVIELVNGRPQLTRSSAKMQI
jgi:hypothetical protein